MAKTSKKRTAGRPPKSIVAPGIHQRGNTYFLRYSANGEQVRVALGTSDPQEAIKRAEELRGRTVRAKKSGRTVGGKTNLDREVEKYTAEKVKSKDFTAGSAKAAAQAIKHFVAAQAALKKPVLITNSEQITSHMLADYYLATRAKQSEATAQTYSTRVATFCRWAGLRVTAPAFVAETPSRTTVVSVRQVADLLDLAKGDLKFILMAGFRTGMRRGEISMARPQWFDLESGRIHIPNPDPVTGFRPKSRRARTIPLVPNFRDFILKEYPDWETRKFCICPNKKVGKWIYRYDFRARLRTFAKKHCKKLTAHVMRHSFASHLANHGVGIAQLAAWTGDRIATLEKHYLHLQVDADKAEAAFDPGWRPEPEQPDEPLPDLEWIYERRFEEL